MKSDVNYVVCFVDILYDLAEMYKFSVSMAKNPPDIESKTWEITLTDSASGRNEIYKVKDITLIRTYDEASSTALNLINDAVLRIRHDGAGCEFDGTVKQRFNIRTGW